MTERFCKVCRGWHDLDIPWPDNCLPERVMTQADFATPMIWRDIPNYRSPIDGKWITSRSHRREDLKINNCVPWEPGMGAKSGASKRTPGKYRNPKFARKRGLPLSEEGHEKLKQMRTEPNA